MKFKGLGVSRQLSIGLGAIFLIVLILALSSLVVIEGLWSSTAGLYDHPLAVSNAVGAIEVDVLSMHRDMGRLVVEGNQQAADDLTKAIDARDADVHRQLDALYAQYLGPQSDIDEVGDAIAHWTTIRSETIRLLRSGYAAEAQSRVKASGVGGQQADIIMGSLEKVSTFATNKGDEFYRAAEQQKNNNLLRLAVILGGTLIALWGIGYLLRQGILPPLKELATATEAMHQGQLQIRSRYESTNEFGALSASFNHMADTLALEMQHKDNVALISSAMFQQDSLHPFCQELLKNLLALTDSQMGAVYLPNEVEKSFQHFESIGLNLDHLSAFSATLNEGELGAAIAAGGLQQITEIPSDARLTWSAVSGSYKPKEIITIPLLNGPKAIAVISLASIKSYTAAHVRLINSLSNEISARLNSLLTAESVREFSHKLQRINQELEAQTKELAMQTDELTEQNIELEMQKQQLNEASQLKSSFLSNMSHELRTPLNSVIALSSVLHRRLQGTIPQEEHSYLDVIERNGKILLSLVNDLLDLSRIESGREELTYSQFELSMLVREIVETLDSQAQNKGIALVNRVSGDLPDIFSDVSKCRHILQNIIGNAVKFTDEGQVVVASAVAHGEIQIVVSDTGIGIAPEHLNFIFDEFRQADETSSRKKGGTGLGLAIAKKYAQMLGASITVASELGKGSTFTLKLPLESRKPAGSTDEGSSLGFAKDEAVAARSARFTGPAKRLLLVEDSEPAIIQITDILAGQGYQIHLARNGKEALEQVESIQPDGMILDLMMPEMDGFQVLKTVRSVEKNAHIPVLILTAKHITRDELSFLKSNHIFQLIQKGAIDKKELLATVGKLVESKDSRENAQKDAPMRRIEGRPTILVVEDNPDNMTTVKALLRDAFEIAEATDGKAGVEQANQIRPSLILMDISLPEMDGFQALAEIRNTKDLQHIPVIALTARAMSGDMKEILAHGFDGYISKPIDGEKMGEAIRRCLDGN